MSEKVLSKDISIEGHFTLESFDSIAHDWKSLQSKSGRSHIFSTFELSRLWWQHFGTDNTLYLGSINNAGETIGIAPLRTKDGVARFIGSTDVCDYLDFTIDPGKEQIFFDTLLKQLKNDGINRLDLVPLRPDSTVATYIPEISRNNGCHASSAREDVTFELQLPDKWEDYLGLLTTKQRHELRRKIRRMSEMGDYDYVTKLDVSDDDIDVFVKLFRKSRDDKQAFLTTDMETFLRALIHTVTEQEWLEMNFLKIGQTIIAATLCFHYRDTTYLYNSGYDPAFSEFSVGLVSKALGIKASIENKRKTFDFLKGSEVYKNHLGGKEIPLYRFTIDLNRFEPLAAGNKAEG